MLSHRNLRNTRQRQFILEELRKKCFHPSADEVYEIVRKRIPRISLGTVYRNLEVLCELGEIQKIDVGGSLMRFDGNCEKHYHIRCINCDRIDDASMHFSEQLENELNGATDYKILSHRLEFLGLCPKCLDNSVNKP